MIEDEEGFASRGDKQWVYMTRAEAYQGLGRTSDEERLGRKIESEATEFGKGSYLEQKAKLKEAIDEFERKVRPDDQMLGRPEGTRHVPHSAGLDGRKGSSINFVLLCGLTRIGRYRHGGCVPLKRTTVYGYFDNGYAALNE